jgi:hypothetical protein
VRDLASGVAVAVAPGRSALMVALIARIAADLGDSVAFGTADLPADARRKTLLVPLGWAGLNTLALAGVVRRS